MYITYVVCAVYTNIHKDANVRVSVKIDPTLQLARGSGIYF